MLCRVTTIAYSISESEYIYIADLAAFKDTQRGLIVRVWRSTMRKKKLAELEREREPLEGDRTRKSTFAPRK